MPTAKTNTQKKPKQQKQQKQQKSKKGGSLYDTQSKYMECNKKQCANASTKYDNSPATIKFNKVQEELKKAVYANKLDYETYKKRVGELQKALDNSPESRALVACSLGSCSEETRNLVINTAKGFAKACKGGVETSCPKAKTAKELSKKPMNVNSFVAFSQL
jgi:hypothetical protein